MNDRIYSVSEINTRVKQLIESDKLLWDIYVRGELSNYKQYPSGHHYFTLKDENGVLKSVMFAREAAGLQFNPQSGLKVIIRGRIAAYPRDGAYQLYANEMIPDGVGALFIAYEQLKQKLAAKGYFDETRKRKLPRYPSRIVIVTSSAGAAIRDMLRILKKRWSAAEVVLIPVRVQGDEAPAEIAAGIRYASEHIDCDLIITGRGGGSIEDLWAFNSELVADAIYESQKPVISAVGHEPDFTIADFVADLRAATPSNAAELCVPDAAEVARRLANADTRVRSLVLRVIELGRGRLRSLAVRPVLAAPDGMLIERRNRLALAEMAFVRAAERGVGQRRDRLSRVAASLDALSPLKVLSRGYALAQHGGAVLRSAKQAKPGDKLSLRFSDGTVPVTVDGDSPPSTPAKTAARDAAALRSDDDTPEQMTIL